MTKISIPQPDGRRTDYPSHPPVRSGPRDWAVTAVAIAIGALLVALVIGGGLWLVLAVWGSVLSMM